MAFSLVGNTITQTGTGTFANTPLDGTEVAAGGTVQPNIGNINGVTTSSTFGNIILYTLPSGTKLIVQGTVNHDTEKEILVLQSPISSRTALANINIDTTGVYNFGIPKPAGSASGAFTDGVGWIFTGGGTTWENGGFTAGTAGAIGGVHVAVQGTMNFNGGRSIGIHNFTFRPGCTVNNNYNAKFLVDDSSATIGTEFLTRIYGGTFNTTNLGYEGGSISLGIGLAPTIIGFDRLGSGVGYWEQGDGDVDVLSLTAPVYNTLQNVTFTNNAVDVAMRRAIVNSGRIAGIRIQNCGNGSNVNVNGGEFDSGATNSGPLRSNAGYVWITRQIDTNILDTANNPVQGRLFIRDTNNGLRTPSQPETSLVDTADSTYSATINGAITPVDGALAFSVTGGHAAQLVAQAGQNEVILGISNVRQNSTNVRGAANAGIWTIDSRSNGGVLGTDVFTGHFWSYENQYLQFNDDLSGEGVHTYQAFAAADPEVTLSRAGVLALDTTLPTTGDLLITPGTAGLVTIQSSMSDTDVYDVIKYRKETAVAHEELPTRTDLTVTRANGVTSYMGPSTDALGVITTIRRSLTVTGTGINLTGNHSGINAFDAGQAALAGSYEALSVTNLATTLGAPDAGALAFNFTGIGAFNARTINDGVPVYNNVTLTSGRHRGIDATGTVADGDRRIPTFTNCTAQSDWIYASTTDLTIDGGNIGFTVTNPGPGTWDLDNIQDGNLNIVFTNDPTGQIQILLPDASSTIAARTWRAGLSASQQALITIRTQPMTITIPERGRVYFLDDNHNEFRGSIADAAVAGSPGFAPGEGAFPAGYVFDVRAVFEDHNIQTDLTFYYKPTNDLNNNVAYNVTTLPRINRNNIGNGQNINAIAERVPGTSLIDVSVSTQSFVQYQSVFARIPTAFDAATDNPARCEVTYRISGVNPVTTLNGATSQRFLLDITDLDAYLRAVAFNMNEADVVKPEQPIQTSTRATTVDGSIIRLENFSTVVTLQDVAVPIGAVGIPVTLGQVDNMDPDNPVLEPGSTLISTALFVTVPPANLTISEIEVGASRAILLSGVVEDVAGVQTTVDGVTTTVDGINTISTEVQNAAGYLVGPRRLGNKATTPYDNTLDSNGDRNTDYTDNL
ncbi:MAG: hypothetical protein K0U41_04940 [Gammaproteobacteria bacterium]|nr:hypothetical protein [Gammaproteobacteria bacterium]